MHDVYFETTETKHTLEHMRKEVNAKKKLKM
jgi:hypothetical protein